MESFTPLMLVFGAAAVGVGVVLVLALRRGRERPTRMWAWVLGLALAVLGTLGNLAILIGTLLAEGGGLAGWLAFGSLALVEATVLAVVRPRWAALVFAATAVVMPALVALTEALGTGPMADAFPAAVVLGFYSTRALVTAVFLGLATWPVRGGRPPASPSPAPRSESVPIA